MERCGVFSLVAACRSREWIRFDLCVFTYCSSFGYGIAYVNR